jgi:putative acetyltransferase
VRLEPVTSESVHIRRYRPGEEAALLEVFYSAIHRVASRDYSAEQINAWAPPNPDPMRWQKKVRAINPFVADLQPDGYIDHFYVCGLHPRRGIGSLLMNRLLREAEIPDVSGSSFPMH